MFIHFVVFKNKAVAKFCFSSIVPPSSVFWSVSLSSLEETLGLARPYALPTRYTKSSMSPQSLTEGRSSDNSGDCVPLPAIVASDTSKFILVYLALWSGGFGLHQGCWKEWRKCELTLGSMFPKGFLMYKCTERKKAGWPRRCLFLAARWSERRR